MRGECGTCGRFKNMELHERSNLARLARFASGGRRVLRGGESVLDAIGRSKAQIAEYRRLHARHLAEHEVTS